MFQFELDARHAPASAPDCVPDDRPELSHRAFLSWAEHCVECAAPACYQTCDLYDPTPLGKCRRFADGLLRTETGADVRFRKWAKLETQGSATMLPVEQVDSWEKMLSLAARPIDVAGKLVHRVTGKDKFLLAREALYKRVTAKASGTPSNLRSQIFLAELTNRGDRPAHLILSAYVDKNRMTAAVSVDQLPPPVNAHIEAPAGFSRHMLDVDSMRPVIESGLPFNFAVTPQDDAEYHIEFHCLDLGILKDDGASVATDHAKGSDWKPAKLVIFDLDNTLWKGVLLEGEVEPYPELKELFRQLDERGILISIASKNAHDDAMAKLDQVGVSEYLLFPQIGWTAKSAGIKRIVEAIDIGSDTVIFVDDNPFEREEVEASVAGVQVLPETALGELLDMPRLAGSNTPEARERRQMYQAAIVRNEAASGYGDDYLDFLRDCQIVTTIRRDGPDDAMRIAELVQRTNQLNFSGTKYTREQTEALLARGDQERYVIDCRDKFGSYGTVGFCLVDREPDATGESDVLHIRDFMLSCRVQGKFIEQAMIWHLAEIGPNPVSEVRVNFRKTERNKAAQMVLEKLAFASDPAGEGYRRRYSAEDFSADFMEVSDKSA